MSPCGGVKVLWKDGISEECLSEQEIFQMVWSRNAKFLWIIRQTHFLIKYYMIN